MTSPGFHIEPQHSSALGSTVGRPKEPRWSAGVGQGKLGEQRGGAAGGAQQGGAAAGVIQGGNPGLKIPKNVGLSEIHR